MNKSNPTAYTLLADDSSPLSNNDSVYREFKAHLIYSVIINGGIVFSDNQIVTSPNLRRLAREDGIIRELFKNNNFCIAIRSDVYNVAGPSSLKEVHQSFVLEGKLNPKFKTLDYSDELTFLDKNSKKIGWSYQQVRENYTLECERILLSCFVDRLDMDGYKRFRDAVVAERLRDKGLGRQFVQYRLPDILTSQGVPFSDADRDMLRKCSDAPYVSNLPRTIGLNPIYAPQHADSFDLVRGAELTYVDVADPEEISTKLSCSHFVEGLIQLDVDDVLALHETHAFRQLSRFQAAKTRNKQSFDAFAEAFYELNVEIEDRIVSRFPGLRISSPAGEKKQARRQAALTFNHGVAVVTDVLTLALDFVSGIPMLGTGTKLIFDRVTNAIEDGGARPKLSIANHRRQMSAYENHLRAMDKAQKLNMDEIVTTNSFSKETIVR